MNERNTKADLVKVRLEAQERLLHLVQGEAIVPVAVTEAAAFAEVDRRTWQRWEKRGVLPKAVLERFWRRVDEAAAKARG